MEFDKRSLGGRLFEQVALAIFALGAAHASPQTPPNILFFFFDDLRWDAAGFAGNTVVTTPHMDSLAARGTLFEEAFVTTSICTVSRASVFTGQHMAKHKVSNFNTIIQAGPWQDSYPARLKAGGYYMGYVGKQHLGGGSSNFIGLYGTYDYNKSYDGGGTYFNMTIQGEPANGRHLTRFLGDLSLGFIDEVVDVAKNPEGKPFCLQVGFKAPHVQDGDPDPFQSDPAYDSLYVDDTIIHAKTDTRAQFDALPSFFRAGSTAGTARWRTRFDTEEKFQHNIKRHHRLIHGVDVQIGRVLAKLDDPNGDGDTSDSLIDNTIIIISSDNGFFLGERQQAGKWYIQEESIRVPKIIADPRLPASQHGKRVRQMVLNIDIPVTILEYAGVGIPDVMQGRSVKPIVDGNPPADWRKVFLHHHPQIGPAVFANEGVRTENFSFTRYPNHNNVVQLYDVSVDPYQRTDLSRDPRYAAKVAELDALTTQLKSDAAQ